MTIKIDSKNKEVLVIPLYEKDNKIVFFNIKNNEKIKEQIIKKLKQYPSFKAKKNQSLFLEINSQKILLIGLVEKFDLENLREAYSIVFKIISSMEEKECLVEIPDNKKETIISTVEGIDLTDYKFDKYLSEKKENNTTFYIDTSKSNEKIIKKTILVNKFVKYARNLVNENSNIIIPEKLEELCRDFAKQKKLKIKVLNEKEIIKQKLNLLEAVGRGSEYPPRLILVEYNGDSKNKEKIALVGKGITFDTGGINLKPSGYLEDMKSDMGGAATMMGTFMAAVELKLKKNIVLVVSTAENAIGGSAFKPGDIFTSYKGVTVEIGNTDAEGRLVLADAMTYAQKHFKVNTIIDAATLTGACLVALGPSLIGMFGNDSQMKKAIFDSGEKTGDRVWELPIYEEHREMIKGKFSDIKNIGGRDGGAITAAAFLEKFVEKDVKWVHLDIAGAARSKKDSFYIPEFGTGRGVRLLIDYLENN